MHGQNIYFVSRSYVTSLITVLSLSRYDVWGQLTHFRYHRKIYCTWVNAICSSVKSYCMIYQITIIWLYTITKVYKLTLRYLRFISPVNIRQIMDLQLCRAAIVTFSFKPPFIGPEVVARTVLFHLQISSKYTSVQIELFWTKIKEICSASIVHKSPLNKRK